jgi:hypothetical protein
MAKYQELPEQITFDAKPYAYSCPLAHTALVVIDMVRSERVTARGYTNAMRSNGIFY